MRITVKTEIIIENGPITEPEMMTYRYSISAGDNSRYWAHAVQCAVGSAAESISESLERKVDLRVRSSA